MDMDMRVCAVSIHTWWHDDLRGSNLELFLIDQSFGELCFHLDYSLLFSVEVSIMLNLFLQTTDISTMPNSIFTDVI